VAAALLKLGLEEEDLLRADTVGLLYHVSGEKGIKKNIQGMQ